MLFQQVKNRTQLTQSQRNRKTRQNFHKQIRKQALNKKISSMRKSLIAENDNQHQSKQEQFLSHFDESYRNRLRFGQQENFQSKQKNDDMQQIILKSLSILSKFSKLQVQKNIGNVEIKRLIKKIDAIICLLMNIDGWILEDQVRENIEEQIQREREIQIEDTEGKGISIVEDNNSQIDSNCINPLKWNQNTPYKPKPKSKMVLLRELIMLVLFQKIDKFLDSINIIFSFYKDSTIISPTLIKWLFFYEQNMKLFYMDMNLQLKQTLQELGENYFIQTIKGYYFDIVFMVVKFMSLQQIIQIFFNSIGDIQGFNFIPNQNLGNNYSLNAYITVSPFQYLIENQQNGYKFLVQLQKQMIAKIQEEQKFICIKKMKALALKQQQNSNFQQQELLSNRQIQLQKSKAILTTLSKKLQNSKKKLQIKYNIEY